MIMIRDFDIYNKSLDELPEGKILINTINAHSYNVSCVDNEFRKVLQGSDILLPDGVSIVLAKRFLNGDKILKIAGADLFDYEMQRINRRGGRVFFLGSSELVLTRIKEKAKIEFPQVTLHTYSPPFKGKFNADDNQAMVNAINESNPDVLFIGMTAPKQELWAYGHKNELKVGHICCIGAVFDFYAGTIKRAPQWMIYLGLEWFYRLIKEPKRMWRRYLIGNVKFFKFIVFEKLFHS